MRKTVIKVKLLVENARVPTYAHLGAKGDLAADLYSAESFELHPHEVRSIRTGIAIEFSSGFGGLVADRSGLALGGFTTLAGVIDPGYRGEIRVVATNLGTETIRIEKGDRIAQMIVLEKIEASFKEVDDLGPSHRADAGFGSTDR